MTTLWSSLTTGPMCPTNMNEYLSLPDEVLEEVPEETLSDEMPEVLVGLP